MRRAKVFAADLRVDDEVWVRRAGGWVSYGRVLRLYAPRPGEVGAFVTTGLVERECFYSATSMVWIEVP